MNSNKSKPGRELTRIAIMYLQKGIEPSLSVTRDPQLRKFEREAIVFADTVKGRNVQGVDNVLRTFPMMSIAQGTLQPVYLTYKPLLKFRQPGEIRRQASCAAYNAMVAVLLSTQDTEKMFATFCLSEHKHKIWECIVDTERYALF